MRTSPASLRWLSSVIPQAMLAPSRCGHAVERGELQTEPRTNVVLADVRLNRVEQRPSFGVAERERAVDRVRLALDVERVHAESPLPELRMRAGVLRKDNDTPPLVHERGLL